MDLDDVYEEIREDARWDHLRQPGIVLVKGRGQTDSPLAMLVGEAPGATENNRRTPFVGASGRVLTGLMGLADLYAEDQDTAGDPETIGIVRANAFITNVVKYRPPGNRTPTTKEIFFGAEALRQEWVALGRPQLIVAVGSTARTALIPPLFGTVSPGNWVALGDDRTFIWSQFHPAWGLRQGPRGQARMEQQWEDMGRWINSNLM